MTFWGHFLILTAFTLVAIGTGHDTLLIFYVGTIALRILYKVA